MLDFIRMKFAQGGYEVMSCITLVLLISIVVIIERAYRYWFKYDVGNSSMFMAVIQKGIMNNSIENAIRNCKSTRYREKLVPFVVKEGLKRANDSTEEIEHSIDRAMLTTMAKVNKRLNFLGTTANVATLLGLLGTLFGLMRSFAAVASETGAEKQVKLAEGIAEALVATSYGLGTALMCLLAFGILQLKQNSIIDDIARSGSSLNELLFTRKMKLKRSK